MSENYVIKDGTMELFLNESALSEFRKGRPVAIFLHTENLKKIILRYGDRPTDKPGDTVKINDCACAEIVTRDKSK